MELNPFPITGDPNFDYFFTLVFIFGMISIGPAMLFKLFKW